MRRDAAILLISLLMSILAKSQTLRRPLAAPYIQASAYSVNQNDCFSFIANQAALAQIKNSAAGVLAELVNYTAVTAIRTSSGNFGIQANYAGFSDYNETQLGLAYGRKLGPKLDVGVQFNYHGIRIAGYGNASTISFEAGTVLHLTDKLQAGIHADNPVGGKFGKDQQEKLPSVYTFGLGYDVSDKLYIAVDLIKEEDQPVNINAGLQYRFIPQLMGRAGISSATSSFYTGIGLSIKSFRIDLTASYHNELGLTPGVLLLFNFNKKEE
jgi:hypothetical protein